MSLKIEQRLLGNEFTENKPIIYSTGVFLVPLKVEINGIFKYIWAVENFSDTTYFEGKEITTNVISDKISEMILD